MIYISIVVQLSRKIIKHVYNEPVYVADGGETMAYSELIKNFNKVCDHMKFHQTSDGKNVFLSIR